MNGAIGNQEHGVSVLDLHQSTVEMATKHSPKTLVNALLDVNLKSVLPLTAEHVARGCKVFGAAILKKDDLSLVMPGTNNEIVSPLLVSRL